MAFLTKEECVRRHRLMWNWIADETERTREVVTKRAAFKYFGWPYEEVHSSCWCCECAINLWQEDETDEEKIICDFCPLDWSIGNSIRRTIKGICCFCPIKWKTELCYDKDGEYDMWRRYIQDGNYEKAAEMARVIANLPEKED